MSIQAAHVVREATPADNDALVGISLATPVEGDIGLAIDRAPDFFALNRLKGDPWWVGVVDGPDGRPVGCVAVAQRNVFLHGVPTVTMAVSDLRVHPDHRRRGIGDALIRWARDTILSASGGVAPPTFVALLAGGDEMARRLGGVRGLPYLHRFATFRCYSVPLLWKRSSDDGLTVSPAGPADVDEMVTLWDEVAPQRQFAPVLAAPTLTAWIDAAPGLRLDSYFLARRPGGELAGFLGIWNQWEFKRLQITSYSPRARAFRTALNTAAPLVKGAKLPAPGEDVRHLIAVHPCVRPSEPAVLRALIHAAYATYRARGFSFITFGLDVGDPLTPALKGWLAQRTDVWTCVATLGERWEGPPLDDRPAYHEIALV